MADKSYKLKVDIEAETSLEDAKAQLKALVELKEQLKGKVDLFKDEDLKGLVELNAQVDSLNKSTKQQKKIVDDLTKAQEKLAKSHSQEAKDIAEINLKTQEQNKLNKQAARERLGLVTLYDRLSKKLEENKKKVRDLLLSEKELSAADKQLIKDTEELDKKLKKVDRSLGDGKRFVGLYTDGIKEAFNETGLFNTGIGRLIIGLGQLKDKLEENSKSSSKFSSNLKLGLVGGIALAVVALKELATINESVKEGFENVIDFVKDLASTGSGFEKLRELTRSFRLEVIGLNETFQKITLDEEDFNEISNDVTLGFKERNEALKEAIKLSEERAAINVKIAEKELEIAEQAIKADKEFLLSGKANPELLEKRSEAQLKFNAALDAQNDLERQNTQRQRERAQAQLIQDLDLIRSKKKSSTAQLDILTEQLNDEKNQLEERRKINDNIIKLNRNTFNEQIKLLEQNTGIQIDQNDLLATSDNILLAQKIKGLNLSEALTDKLAEIIKKQQDAEIQGKKDIAKLDEEELQRKQKLAEIDRQINISTISDQVKDQEKAVEDQLELDDKLKEKLLKRENIFNPRLIKLKKISDQNQQNQNKELFEKKLSLLDANAENERIAIENSVKDEKIKAAEIKKINEQLQIDKNNLLFDQSEKERKLREKALKDQEEIARKQLDLIIEQTDFVVGKVGEALDKRSQKNIDRIEKEQAKQDEALQKQEERAALGLKNEIEVQQEKAAQLEIQREEEQRKQENREKILSYYNLLSGYAKEDANTALSRASKDIAISEGIVLAFGEKGGVIEDIKGTTQLKDGTLTKTHSSGDRLIVTSPKEGLLNERQMNALGGKEGFYNLTSMLDNPKDVMFPSVPVFKKETSASGDIELYSRLKRIETAIINKPVSNSRIDNVGDVIITTVEKGVKHTLKVVSQKPRFKR